MSMWIVVAIAIFVLVIWLAFQPKQGATAANAPKTDPDASPSIPLPTVEKPIHFSEDVSHLPPDQPTLDNVSSLPPESPRFEDQSPSRLGQPTGGKPIVISDDLRQQVQQLVAEGQTITAVKKLRQQGMALREAKQYLDALPQRSVVDEVSPSAVGVNRTDVASEVRLLLSQNRKIQAIKLVRLQLGYSLKEAKDYVESIER